MGEGGEKDTIVMVSMVSVVLGFMFFGEMSSLFFYPNSLIEKH